MSSVASLTLAAIERGYELLNHVDYRLAETPAEREQIYRLRYRAYLQEGAIGSAPTNASPTASTICRTRGFSASTTTVRWQFEFESASRRPRCRIRRAVDAFSDVLHPELAKGKIIVDPTRFVADPTRAKTYRELPYLTVRLGYIGCEHFGADLRPRPACGPTMPSVLSPRVPAGTDGTSPAASRVDLAGLPDGGDYRSVRERIFQRYPVLPHLAVRASHAVRAPPAADPGADLASRGARSRHYAGLGPGRGVQPSQSSRG